jgi:hypothetical protein
MSVNDINMLGKLFSAVSLMASLLDGEERVFANLRLPRHLLGTSLDKVLTAEGRQKERKKEREERKKEKKIHK